MNHVQKTITRFFLVLSLSLVCFHDVAGQATPTPPYRVTQDFPGGGKAKFYTWKNGIPENKRIQWMNLMMMLGSVTGTPVGGVGFVVFPCAGYYCPDPVKPPRSNSGSHSPTAVAFGPSIAPYWGAFIHKNLLCKVSLDPAHDLFALNAIWEELHHLSADAKDEILWSPPIPPGSVPAYNLYSLYSGFKVYYHELIHLGALAYRMDDPGPNGQGAHVVASGLMPASDDRHAENLEILKKQIKANLKFYKDCYEKYHASLVNTIAAGVPSSSGLGSNGSPVFPAYDELVAIGALSHIDRYDRQVQRAAERAASVFCD